MTSEASLQHETDRVSTIGATVQSDTQHHGSDILAQSMSKLSWPIGDLQNREGHLNAVIALTENRCGLYDVHLAARRAKTHDAKTSFTDLGGRVTLPTLRNAR